MSATKRFTSFVLTFMTIFIVINNCYGQEKCGEILRYGIFDYTNTVDTSTFVDNVLKVYAYQNIKSSSEAKNVKFDNAVTIPIEEMLVKNEMSYLDAHSQNSSFSESVYDYYQRNISIKKRFSQVLKKANKELISAWSECMKQKPTGFKCWFTPGEGKDLYYLNAQLTSDLDLGGRAVITGALFDRRAFRFNEPVINKSILMNGRAIPFQGTIKNKSDDGFDLKLTILYKGNSNHCITGIKPIVAVKSPDPVPPTPRRDIIIVPAKDFIKATAINVETSAFFPYGSDVLHNNQPGDAKNLAEYDVKFKHLGKYDFIMTCASLDPRPFAVFLNGELINGHMVSSPTGGWGLDKQEGIRVGIVEIKKKGINRIKLERDGAFPHILQLSFTPVEDNQ